eukprot:COSAG03_NODE_1230_length_4512_cov_5.281668_3_plen_93_part_00
MLNRDAHHPAAGRHHARGRRPSSRGTRKARWQQESSWCLYVIVARELPTEAVAYSTRARTLERCQRGPSLETATTRTFDSAQQVSTTSPTRG